MTSLEETLNDFDPTWVDRTIFADEAVYRHELKAIFYNGWQFVAHRQAVRKVGDFVTGYMGEDSIIVCRASDDEIEVFLNSCPHRGNRICLADRGSVSALVCNYHGWRFKLTGELAGLPAAHLYAASPDFRREDLSLTRARVETYGDFVFATFNPDAPPLRDYLGDFKWYLDAILETESGGTEVLPGVIKTHVKANWKIIADNAAGDYYHTLWTHRSGIKASLGPDHDAVVDQNNSFQVNAEGHGWHLSTVPYSSLFLSGDWKLLRYAQSKAAEYEDRLGVVRAAMRTSSGSACVFPNFIFVPSLFTFRVLIPRGPNSTEIHSWTIVPMDMPPEIKARARLAAMKIFSPAGLFGADDVEIWEQCSAAHSGYVTRRQRLFYGLAPTQETDPSLPGDNVRGHVSDFNQQAFYRRWRDLMLAAID